MKIIGPAILPKLLKNSPIAVAVPRYWGLFTLRRITFKEGPGIFNRIPKTNRTQTCRKNEKLAERSSVKVGEKSNDRRGIEIKYPKPIVTGNNALFVL